MSNINNVLNSIKQKTPDYKVVYGDTDSIFVVKNVENNKEQIKSLTNKMVHVDENFTEEKFGTKQFYDNVNNN